MGPIGCPETSLQNYHTTLRNISEEHRSHLHRGGSLESRSSVHGNPPAVDWYELLDILVFIHQLLNDAVASSDYTASDGTGESVEGRGRGQI
jgi:hypothetical protein